MCQQVYICETVSETGWLCVLVLQMQNEAIGAEGQLHGNVEPICSVLSYSYQLFNT